MPSTTTINSTLSVQLRPIRADNVDFLRNLYATTRYDVQRSGLPQDQQDELCAHQFEAQHRHYQNYFPDASFDLICIDGEPIGRIYVDVNRNEIRLIDIALLPEYRGRGIGRILVGDLQQKSRQLSLPLRLRVEPDNPALRLYRRLGFHPIADEQINLHMEWNPALNAAEAS